LRGVGYSLETAIADLVDNSIAAGSDGIDIHWEWNGGNPWATILDDGCGMTEERLVEAMRFGGAGPESVRQPQDLGRFGLGLKTASHAQCRQLTVSSKTESGTTTFTWDLDHIRKAGEKWSLLEGGDPVGGAADAAFQSRRTGTLVVWRKVDFGRQEDRPDHATFLQDLERLDRHLGMVFHRFLAGDARRVAIRLNGRGIEAWDPFLETDEATIRTPAQPLSAPGGRVQVRGFVLPHRDRFTSEQEFERAGGPEGWTAQQGFYVYRQKRLLSWGGWLGLGGSRAWTREEPSRLARIRVDIPNTADHEWRIDIRKAIARPPDAIRKPLQRIAENIRSKAREVFVHRGQYGPRASSAPVSKIWQINPPGARRRYAIRRDHELVVMLREKLPRQSRELLDGLLDQVERTVPVDRVWLDVTEQGVPASTDPGDDLLEAALSLVRMMEKSGVDFTEAAARVAMMEPFDQVENLEKRLRQGGEKRG
jgi:hypothetical protein